MQNKTIRLQLNGGKETGTSVLAWIHFQKQSYFFVKCCHAISSSEEEHFLKVTHAHQHVF